MKKAPSSLTSISSLEIPETQPSTSDNDILESREEESRDFNKTPSSTVICIQKSLSSENSETPKGKRNIRVQFSALKRRDVWVGVKSKN